MTYKNEYQAFVLHVMCDMSQLAKQYKAYEELKGKLEMLHALAARDPDAARRLEQINALDYDANFQALCSQAEKELRIISRQIDGLSQLLKPAESMQTTTVPQVKLAKQEVHVPRKPHKPQFV